MVWKPQRDLFALGTILAVVVLVAVFGPSLPDQIPSHFDLRGNVDDTMQRSSFLLLIAGLSVGIYGLLTFLPFADPFWKKIQPRYGTLMILRDISLAFVLVAFLISFFAAKDGHIPLNMLGASLGVFFILLGNYLPRVPRNWFFGIRTPWTLVSDTVWQKSHILGGWLFVASGILTIVLSLLSIGMEYSLLPALVITVIVAGIVYPYHLQHKLNQDGIQ